MDILNRREHVTTEPRLRVDNTLGGILDHHPVPLAVPIQRVPLVYSQQPVMNRVPRNLQVVEPRGQHRILLLHQPGRDQLDVPHHVREPSGHRRRRK